MSEMNKPMPEESNPQTNESEIKTQKEHFEYLTNIAGMLLADGLDKITDVKTAEYYYILEDGHTRVFTHRQLVRTLKSNFESACLKHSFEIFLCLSPHIAAEYPDFQDMEEYMKIKPLRYIEILRTLAQRKTFKGICSMCLDQSD